MIPLLLAVTLTIALLALVGIVLLEPGRFETASELRPARSGAVRAR